MNFLIVLVNFCIFSCVHANGYDGYQEEEEVTGPFLARENYYNNYPQPYPYPQPMPDPYMQPYPRAYPYGHDMGHQDFEERAFRMPQFQMPTVPFPSFGYYNGAKDASKAPSTLSDPNLRFKKAKRVTKKMKKPKEKLIAPNPMEVDYKTKSDPKAPTECNCKCSN